MDELLKFVEEILDKKLAENIISIDMQGNNPFTDHFVICTAKNIRHADSLATDLIQEARKNGYEVREREGEDGSSWILVDLYGVIVHIFTEDARNQYRLENLWADLNVEHYPTVKESL